MHTAPAAGVSVQGKSAATAGAVPPLALLWDDLQTTLPATFGDENYAAWLAPLKVQAVTADSLTLAAPTTFIAQWVRGNYLTQLEEQLSSQAGRPVAIELQVVPTFAVSASAPQSIQAAVMSPTAPEAAAPEWLSGSRLDARYGFHQFVTGKSNQFAFTAAQSVAEALTQGKVAYNPFFLHGGVGLGKTHLMQAIGHAVLESGKPTNVLYLSAEQFLYKFIRALKDKNTLGFKELFRSVDVLMIDDLQFIAGKDATQEEFFHTFNTLIQAGKQVVLTADRSPHELPNIEERLKSRLGSGLTVEVHAPEEETRLAILQSKAESMGYTVPAEVLQLLAAQIASNVRELEGALNRLVAYARLTGEALTPDLARDQLRDLFRVYNRVITIDDIQQKVATQFNIRVSDMHSPRRAREVARPRQVAMYLAKQLTSRSYPDIGRAFGGRDHTTVIHACETIVALLPRDAQLAEQVQLVTRTLQGR
ncbi:MAG: chromosomal replication initiator protein DnaA [Proteobacteria bacterium]|nr:chromosomal replication initiator protein DnaA [Pseudomonadota bacterium]